MGDNQNPQDPAATQTTPVEPTVTAPTDMSGGVATGTTDTGAVQSTEGVTADATAPAPTPTEVAGTPVTPAEPTMVAPEATTGDTGTQPQQ